MITNGSNFIMKRAQKRYILEEEELFEISNREIVIAQYL